MSDKQTVAYLETTAAIDASFKSFPEVLDIIKSADRLLTSQYVKMEIKRGFLNNLVLLHNKMIQCEKWSEVQQFVATLAAGPRRYYMAAALDFLVRFWTRVEMMRGTELAAKYGDREIGDILMEDSINFLRTWIKRMLPNIDKLKNSKVKIEMMNPMDCYLDLEGAIRKGDLYDNTRRYCTDSHKTCMIRQFFVDNGHDFEKIHDRLKKLPDSDTDSETKKRISTLHKILKRKLRAGLEFSNKSPFEDDAKWCWACGDAIHAVMAPKGAQVVNRNKKHFDPICEAIGKESKVYTSPKV